MSTTFQKCPELVSVIAGEILQKFETHKPLIDSGVGVDFVFAYAEKDEKTGEPIGDALSKNGVKALGICRKIPLKDRAMGRADAEICIDGDWWEEATDEERRALLDHELHHIAIKIDKRGLVRDDLGRPVLQLRKHDFEVGWFKVIAARHGDNSQERLQARQVMGLMGQYFWPDIIPPTQIPSEENTSITLETGGKSVKLTAKELRLASKRIVSALEKHKERDE